MTKIKICGLTRPCDIDAVNAAMPDFVGFVFAKSRRQVDDRQASALRERLDSRIQAVGVFVDENPARICELLKAGIIDIAQLHGDEDAAYLANLRRRTAAPLIKAIRVKDRAALSDLAELPSDYLLLDSYAAGVQGGTGKRFDWDLLADLTFPRPIFLAGGLDVGSIPEAITRIRPYAIDISSGVETDGVKDPAKIAAAVAAVRAGEH